MIPCPITLYNDGRVGGFDKFPKSIKLGGPDNGIQTKTVHNTLQGDVGVQKSSGPRGCSFTALLVGISDTVLGVLLKLSGVPFGRPVAKTLISSFRSQTT